MVYSSRLLGLFLVFWVFTLNPATGMMVSHTEGKAGGHSASCQSHAGTSPPNLAALALPPNIIPPQKVLLSPKDMQRAVLHDPEQFELTRELVQDSIVAPRYRLDLPRFSVYFSKLILSKNEIFVLMYFPDALGRYFPRLLNKSRSGGFWRVIPVIAGEGPWKGWYSKGKDLHYTQETRIHPSLMHFLESLEPTVELTPQQLLSLESNFYEGKLVGSAMNTYNAEIHLYQDDGTLKGFQEAAPGNGFDARPRDGAYLEHIDRVNELFSQPSLADFLPDFSKSPIETYQVSHLLLSRVGADGVPQRDITVKVYLGKLRGNEVEWHMARDRSGRTWIDRIRFKSDYISTYGTDPVILPSGVLTHKPLEYKISTVGLQKGKEYEDFNQLYVDLSPLLINLLPIQLFVLMQPLSPIRVDESGDTPLHRASAAGQLKEMRKILDAGTSANIANDTQRTPLHSAAQGGHGRAVRLLLRRGASAAVRSYRGWTPLIAAAAAGQINAAKLLLKSGAQLNEISSSGKTPLHVAAESDQAAMVGFLLDQGANPNTVDFEKATPLYSATFNEHPDVIRLLLARGANPDTKDKLDRTPLHLAVLISESIVAAFLDAGVSPDLEGPQAKTPLFFACQQGNLEMVRFLILHHANINKKDTRGESPLSTAVKFGHAAIVEELRKAGAT